MLDAQIRQLIVDEEQLRLLRIGYFVSAISTGFFALFGLLYAGIGLVLSAMPEAAQAQAQAGQESPPEIGLIFAVGGSLFAFAFGAVAGLKLYVARCLKQRRGRGLCQVVAAISCLELPYGTVLGIFTFTVLSRPSVLRLFDRAPAPSPAVVAQP